MYRNKTVDKITIFIYTSNNIWGCINQSFGENGMRNTKKLTFLILLIALAIFLSGCSTFQYLDGSQDKDVLEFCTGEQLNALGETPDMERRRIEIEKRAKMQVNSAQSKRRTVEKEKVGLEGEIDTLKKDISSLEEKLASLNEENKGLKSEQNQARLQSIAAKVNLVGVKIKVLSGSGSLNPALDMVKQLEANGYKVERTDIAPSTDFSSDKVFFTKGNDSTAREIAEKIGSTAVAAPMTWDSEFDIIVVTRNKDFVK